MIFNMIAGSVNNVKLNYSIEAYTSEDLLPETANENSIGIITDTSITSYVFSATEPEVPIEGMVWICTGTATEYELNLLIENSAIVYLGYTKQYIDSAWVDVAGLVYQNDAWVTFAEASSLILLYNAGDGCTDVTGGWTVSGYTCGSYPINNGGKGSSSMVLYAGYSDGAIYSIAGTVNKVDLTNIDTISANITISENTGSVRMRIVSSKDVSNKVKESSMVYSLGSHTLTADTSSLSGSYYVAIFSYGSTSYGQTPVVKITKVWGE